MGTGSVVLLLVHVPLDEGDSTDETCVLTFTIDGSFAGTVEQVGFEDAIGESWTPVLAWVKTGLSAASHTFKVQWKTGPNTAACNTHANSRDFHPG